MPKKSTNPLYNTTESCINEIEFTQEKAKGYKGLDEVMSGIFDKPQLCIRNRLNFWKYKGILEVLTKEIILMNIDYKRFEPW